MTNDVLLNLTEAYMIDSLVQSQEIQDRKKLTLIGHKKEGKSIDSEGPYAVNQAIGFVPSLIKYRD